MHLLISINIFFFSNLPQTISKKIKVYLHRFKSTNSTNQENTHKTIHSIQLSLNMLNQLQILFSIYLKQELNEPTSNTFHTPSDPLLHWNYAYCSPLEGE